MRTVARDHKFFGIALLWAGLVVASSADVALAQDPDKALVKPGAKTDETEIIEATPDPAVRKIFSRETVHRFCHKFENQLIAYYGDVWKVTNCERHPIMSNKTVYELQRSGRQILDVDGDTVAAIPEGEPLDLAITVQAARGCKALEGHYVTYSNVDVYYVEHCRRRMFPDWASYIKHREKRDNVKGEILALSWVEFDQVQPGEDLPSVLDEASARNLRGEHEVDVIPVDEACAGVEGKVVAYYSHLYRIEHCRKRELLAPGWQLHGTEGVNDRRVQELSSEQWISLPIGQPIGSAMRQETGPGPQPKRASNR